MDKITKKILKYFLFIITLVIIICFFESTFIISKVYTHYQYLYLKDNAMSIYDSLKAGETINIVNINGFIIKNDNVYNLGHGKMMSFTRNVDLKSLKEKDFLKSPMGQQNFLTYKLTTELGDIVVLKNYKESSDYLNIVYLILVVVFFTAIILSIPLIIYLGKKFTDPILKLQKASSDIAKENFNVDIDLKTGDEIEELANSLKYMSSQLEKKHILQRDFIANVSHDFKTPLSIIRNYSEANYDGIIDHETSKYYSKEIINEVDRLNKLVMDLMQLSKLQGEAVVLKPEFFNLEEFLRDILYKFNSLSKDNNIFINLIIDKDIKENKIFISADSYYLSRVIYNFMDNALKFSKQNSSIDVVISKCEIDSLKITVKDYGQGIPEDMLENIWDKYYKHSESGGIGIGLAICSEILKKHNFKYGVKSIYGDGSEFFCIIPKNKIEYRREL